MKLNLGCGTDAKSGYTNVDFRDLPGVQKVDLSKLPWPWKDGEADEIIMLDFLEHFPYKKTEPILQECWRVLRTGGRLDVQVPDLSHCGRAASNERPFMCNRCGWTFSEQSHLESCGDCGQSWADVALAASQRLMGGQDYEGNWHYACFSPPLLEELLLRNGFEDVQELTQNENGESYYQNWNVKLRATKGDVW